MKFLLIISFLFSLLLSSETRLVIGSFKEEKNAKFVKTKIDKIIQNDTKFKNFLNKNGIKTEQMLLGEWYVVCFEPFENSKTKMITYFKIKKLYPDTYSLVIHEQDAKEMMITPENVESMIATEDTTSNHSASVQTPQETIEKVSETEQTMDKQALEDIITNKNVTEEESNPVASYLFAIILIILFIVAVIVYMIQKRSNKTDLTEIED